MHVFIVTYGSLGDVLPYVALGKGLLAKGHRVTLCTGSKFEAFVRDHGLSYAYMNNGFTDLLESQAGRAAIENLRDLWGAIKTGARLAREIGPLQRRTLGDAWRAFQEAEPDLLLYYPKVVEAPRFAETLNIPAVMAPLFPQFVPTREFPSIGFPDWKAGNRWTYRIVLGLTRLLGSKYVKEWQRANGLPVGTAGVLQRRDGEPIPVMHGFSRHLVPIPKDWPPGVTATGFWFLEQRQGWQPAPDLRAFLEAGEAPVYVGFGSMAGRNPRRVTELVIEALLQAGMRGIIATGWGGLESEELPETLLKIDQAPHDWLFPRVSTVVHHGGAGTTAAGLRAGRPTIICPFFGDQPFWGRRVHTLGAGPRPIPQRKLTVRKLAAALRAVRDNPGYGRQAEALGRRIRREDGIDQAVRWLEAVAARTHRKEPP